MTEIAKASKVGFNALTETNPNNLNYSSDYNTLKYYSSGTFTDVLNNSTSHFHAGSIAHNLGYNPFFYVMSNRSDQTAGYYQVVPDYQGGIGPTMNVYVDNTYIYFRSFVFSGGGSNITFTYAYKIFKNNLGL